MINFEKTDILEECVMAFNIEDLHHFFYSHFERDDAFRHKYRTEASALAWSAIAYLISDYHYITPECAFDIDIGEQAYNHLCRAYPSSLIESRFRQAIRLPILDEVTNNVKMISTNLGYVIFEITNISKKELEHAIFR